MIGAKYYPRPRQRIEGQCLLFRKTSIQRIDLAISLVFGVVFLIIWHEPESVHVT
jgi:hypothetical protein